MLGPTGYLGGALICWLVLPFSYNVAVSDVDSSGSRQNGTRGGCNDGSLEIINGEVTVDTIDFPSEVASESHRRISL